ncbi:rhodanese-like domain-containing protein [Thalassococcus sp. S3]|uniref:rhodanese-like domain-containing protein n=1 Tax=Thalassococcus sp. S3 TaxID=2017482 RepID=UPI0020C4C0B5|nr:rhodanese-like domain-containing protein [Thalassococcus sp. S3]
MSTLLSRRKALAGLALLISGAGYAGASYLYPSRPSSIDVVTVDQVYSMAQRGEVLLVDIRRPDEWDRTGIAEGAHPLDMRRSDFVAALDSLTGADRARPIALICARGVRSARLSAALTDAGFTRIIDVPEGMLGSLAGPGWLKSELPTRRP